MPAAPVVLRIPRVNHNGYILLHVSSAGGRQLDLKLTGTESENLFSVELKHNQISKLRSKTLDQAEWETVLLSMLLGIDRNGAPIAAPEGIEAMAKVDGKITITIQRNIEGITQKLGSISLSEDPGAIDLFEWCGTAIEAKNCLVQELSLSKAKLAKKDAHIERLEQSLAEMVTLKNQNETQLLEKFSLLLNEKKLKIRDQQRLLYTSNSDPRAVEAMEQRRLALHSRPTGASREGKRKAGEAAENEGSDDGYVKMEIDNETEPSESDGEKPQDNSTADEDTASENAEDEEPAPPPTRKPVNDKPIGSSQHSLEIHTPDLMRTSPERESPFARPAAKVSASASGESETEDEDDEL
ncbi:hypothetical protein QTJ16_006155 [Diplocarpon rosae]|uniref:DNA double-strand break repair and VJ recombination XRCC4 n=1 Tax=Diplocarpon rosae TaxID=946125 RepID=A0AAD9SV00_9HELO|nr:hypothetical protein QTJ16_006155 [Diplocarpon rosae]PBP23804.1 hypothetical protein BUE80_DR005475 [Diplocarpon rosae]